jgi:hypothetical protein
MFTAYVVVTLMAAAATAFTATADFLRPQWVLANMTRAGVPQSRLFSLGALKAAGALGLLVGLGVPLLGVGAAVGLVLFFVWCHHHPHPCPLVLVHHPPRRFSCWPWARWGCDWPRPERSRLPQGSRSLA